jgi:hypothetical protein
MEILSFKRTHFYFFIKRLRSFVFAQDEVIFRLKHFILPKTAVMFPGYSFGYPESWWRQAVPVAG